MAGGPDTLSGESRDFQIIDHEQALRGTILEIIIGYDTDLRGPEAEMLLDIYAPNRERHRAFWRTFDQICELWEQGITDNGAYFTAIELYRQGVEAHKYPRFVGYLWAYHRLLREPIEGRKVLIFPGGQAI